MKNNFLKDFPKTFTFTVFLDFSGQVWENKGKRQQAKAISIRILVQKVWHFFFSYNNFLLGHKVSSNKNINVYIDTHMCIHSVLAHQTPGWHISYNYCAKKAWFLTTFKVLEQDNMVFMYWLYFCSTVSKTGVKL